MEGEETLEEAAAREVAEETGITGRVLTSLGTIDYWFSTADKRVHKVVHHYLLEATGGELSIEGDPDGEAIDAAWFPLAEVHEHLTFPNERRIARAAWERLAGTT
jgi:8-oxo-dGTP pyrophosphatase MutT (NUDIX family)